MKGQTGVFKSAGIYKTQGDDNIMTSYSCNGKIGHISANERKGRIFQIKHGPHPLSFVPGSHLRLSPFPLKTQYLSL